MQTTVQNEAAIRDGSVRIEVGDDPSSYVDIGAIRNPVFTSLVENQSIEFDNVKDFKKFVNGDKVQFAFELIEINLTNMAQLDAGLVTLSTVAGTPVAGASYLVASGAWSYNNFIAFDNQNGDGTAPTVNSVTLGTDGLIVLDTDFVMVKQGGTWGIVIIDSTTVTTEAQTVTINTDYTPAASKKLSFSNSGTKTEKYVRVTNTDENGKVFQFVISEATNFSAPSIDFAGDDEAEVAVLPIQMEGTLVEIIDEQQTV